MRIGRVLAVAAVLLSIPAAASGQASQNAGGGTVLVPLNEERSIRTGVQETATEEPVSPGGAFLRSLVVPGWGQAAVGSYTRAGFYFTTSSATVWMLFKTTNALREAEEARDLVTREVEDRLRREGVTEPAEIAEALEEDPLVQSHQELVDTRAQQFEDWTAFGVFWLLLNAADAFVAGHLADFPEPVEVELAPVSPQGRSEVRIRVPVGGPRR